MTPLHTIDRHHLIPKYRLRRGAPRTLRSNKVRLKRFKHNAWHALFGHKTLDEIIALLERLREIKSQPKRGRG